MKNKRGTTGGTKRGTATYVQRVIDLNSQGLTIRKIATTVGKSKSQVHRILKRGQEGQTNRGYMGQPPKFEIHNYQVRVKIIEKPKNWTPNLILNFKKIKFKEEDQHGWTKYLFTYNDCSVHITPYNILMFPPKIRSSISPTDAKLVADQTVLDLVPKLEKLLEIKLSNTNKVTFFDVTKQHMAMIQDDVFDALKKEGFESIKDEKGNTRLILDESNGAKHIEGIHSTYADSDITQFEELIRESLTGKFSLSDMKRAIGTNQKAIVDLMMKNTPAPEEDLSKNRKIPEYIN